MLLVKAELCSTRWKVADMVGPTLKKGRGREVSHIYSSRLYLGATCDVTRSTWIGYKRVKRRKRMRAILQSSWKRRVKHIFKAQIQLFHVKHWWHDFRIFLQLVLGLKRELQKLTEYSNHPIFYALHFKERRWIYVVSDIYQNIFHNKRHSARNVLLLHAGHGKKPIDLTVWTVGFKCTRVIRTLKVRLCTLNQFSLNPVQRSVSEFLRVWRFAW